MDLIKTPLRTITSKPAQKTYLNTILVVATSSILFGCAVLGYVLFYWSYVPQMGVERVVYLQFGTSLPPHGHADLQSSLIPSQPYDIEISLLLPRSPRNLQQGNFMLSLSLLSSTYPLPLTTTPLQSQSSSPLRLEIPANHLIFTSSRPALIPYTSPLTSLSKTLLNLPFYIFSFKTESEALSIPMAESLSFPKGKQNIPRYLLLEIQAAGELEIYEVKVHFLARFEGLRWWMWRFKVLSFIIGVGTFWGAEMIGACISWFILNSLFSGEPGVKEEGEIKSENGIKTENGIEDEEPQLSDTPRSFPTYGKQAPLQYIPAANIKVEGDILGEEKGLLEADDEDEDGTEEEDRGRDSGIGTSFSEGGNRGVVKKRRKREGL